MNLWWMNDNLSSRLVLQVLVEKIQIQFPVKPIWEMDFSKLGIIKVFQILPQREFRYSGTYNTGLNSSRAPKDALGRAYLYISILVVL